MSEDIAEDRGKQLTLDGSCLHVWEPYTAQPKSYAPREICRICGTIRLSPETVKREPFTWEKRPPREW